MLNMPAVSYAELESKVKTPIAIECHEQEKDSQLVEELQQIEKQLTEIFARLKAIENTNALMFKAYISASHCFRSLNERMYLHENRIQDLEVRKILPWQRS